MAVDIAMKFYLRSPPMRRDRAECKISPNTNKPLRPCIQTNCKPLLKEIKNQENKVKKRVSFADNRGLELTMVKVFSDFDDQLEIPFNITELIDNIVTLTIVEKVFYKLDFTQPSADYLDFRNRLQTGCVCLENCVIKEKTIMGTVKVRNLSFEKRVKIRMTYSSWQNFIDYDCKFIKETYAGTDRDTFSFDIIIPENIPPHARIEFAICFECDGKMYWDSNKGQNYRIIRPNISLPYDSDRNRHEPDFNLSFDQFGSPRCSSGIFPEWPSYSEFGKIGPYY
ncbi:protein phosphatase 1 regulatory subunit 3B [Discoglossus pictus]